MIFRQASVKSTLTPGQAPKQRTQLGVQGGPGVSQDRTEGRPLVSRKASASDYSRRRRLGGLCPGRSAPQGSPNTAAGNTEQMHMPACQGSSLTAARCPSHRLFSQAPDQLPPASAATAQEGAKHSDLPPSRPQAAGGRVWSAGVSSGTSGLAGGGRMDVTREGGQRRSLHGQEGGKLWEEGGACETLTP